LRTKKRSSIRISGLIRLLFILKEKDYQLDCAILLLSGEEVCHSKKSC